MNIMEYAIQMEKDGEEYYNKQAEINKGNSLHTVCVLLAIEERRHAQILRNIVDDLPYTLQQSEIYSEVKSMFYKMNDFENEIKDIPSQLDFYRFALENEQKSIDLYKEFLEKSQDEEETTLFSYLVQQEQNHFQIINQFVKILTHAEQWVESAEFGTRDEY